MSAKPTTAEVTLRSLLKLARSVTSPAVAIVVISQLDKFAADFPAVTTAHADEIEAAVIEIEKKLDALKGELK
jgi:hypothetical protein